MVSNIKFRRVNDMFQMKLKKDIRTTRNSNKIYVVVVCRLAWEATYDIDATSFHGISPYVYILCRVVNSSCYSASVHGCSWFSCSHFQRRSVHQPFIALHFFLLSFSITIIFFLCQRWKQSYFLVALQCVASPTAKGDNL